MAATAGPLPAFDLQAPSSYPIRLGASIARPANAKAYSTVRYNHKPRRKAQTEVSGSIRPSKNNSARLLLQNGNDEYAYKGKAADDTGRYVMLSRGSGKDTEFVLEKLSGSHDFNMTSTPAEKDANKLAERYQQLQPEDQGGEGLFGDEDMDDPVDENNPFDFRNHLKPKKLEPEPTGADTPRSTIDTPRPTGRAATSTPLAPPKRPDAASAATQKKRRAAEPLKPNPKRVKAGIEPPPPTASSNTKSRDVPSVRIDRKASVRRPSFDDSGELILENETPITEKPPRAPGAMALALSGQLGAGPISLRSAASSPASRNASPMPLRPDGVESPEEFELGESSPEDSGKRPRARSPGDYFSNAGDDDGDANADVEDLELPSPRQRRKSVANVGLGDGGGADEDYDMERELELALAQDDGAIAQPTVLNESDEESEEE